ncbi:hypothetical protein POX_c03682 [Penicillium oxalicum]|uniref:Uncharacterized protein n=1 Tax=Penicillium oxalicum (strain 114-2 / CGMCC 5302) TaxID=933388 RepID=S7Z594_PENO1|nr:hypothetical protein POX_c03682 [Penicillium oxalicum]EPS25279.1 hypothetical protein PDE_00212 [Penicillium oxalicum 114-2]KAI2790831.1 hypothetical protein POX_c03682 [Penicillium oxalicum]
MPKGFTAVAFTRGQEDGKVQVIGTASMKPWKCDGLWSPDEDESEDQGRNNIQEPDVNQKGGEHKSDDEPPRQFTCPGDWELAVVALPPDICYRGKGIAGRVVKACEDEVLRR